MTLKPRVVKSLCQNGRSSYIFSPMGSPITPRLPCPSGNAESFFSDTMKEPVGEIIKYLRKSKGARMRLENPPLYKPKKDKKKGMVSSMLGL